MEELMRWPVFQALGRSKTSLVRAARVLSEGYAALIANFDDSVSLVASVAQQGATPRPVREKKILELSGKRVKHFEIARPCLALCEDGSVYELPRVILKDDNRSVLVIPSEMMDVKKFEEASPHRITQLVSGSSHTVALTDSGRVLVWGGNSFCQCGMESKSSQYMRPDFYPSLSCNLDHVISVAAASQASGCLTSRGDIYLWGGIWTQGIASCVSRPTKLDQAPGYGSYCQLAIAKDFGIALTKFGKVVAWGMDEYSAAGRGVEIKPNHLTDIKERVVEIAADKFQNRAMALTSKGVVYKIRLKSKSHSSWTVTESEHSSLEVAVSSSDADNVYTFSERSIKTLIANAFAVSGSYRTIHCSPSAATAMRRAFNNSGDFDIKFIVEDKAIFVHKTVLSLQSEYFKAMFNGDWKESGNEIKITSSSHSVYHAVLQYFYTEELELTSVDDLQELLLLAHQLLLPTLVHDCARRITRHLTVDNVCAILSLSRAVELQNLTDSCIQFAQAFMSDVLRSEAFAKLGPGSGYSLVCAIVGNPFTQSGEGDASVPSTSKKETNASETPEKGDSDGVDDFDVYNPDSLESSDAPAAACGGKPAKKPRRK